MEWSGVEWSRAHAGYIASIPSALWRGVVLTYRHHLHMHLSSYPDVHGSELRRAIPLWKISPSKTIRGIYIPTCRVTRDGGGERGW